MVSPIYIFRVAALGLATILSIIVIALGAQTSAAVKRITPEELADFEAFNPGKSQFAYGNVGVASGVMMLLSTLVIFLCDFLGAAWPILAELFWFTVLWVLFAVTGGLALKEASFFASFVGQLAKGCDEFESNLGTVCHEAQPLGIVAIMTMALLLMYSLTLLVVAFVGTFRGRNLWLGSIRPSGSTTKA